MPAYGQVCPQTGGQGNLEAHGRALASLCRAVHEAESCGPRHGSGQAVPKRHPEVGSSLNIPDGGPELGPPNSRLNISPVPLASPSRHVAPSTKAAMAPAAATGPLRAAWAALA